MFLLRWRGTPFEEHQRQKEAILIAMMPSGDQTRLAGKSLINRGFKRKNTYEQPIFQHALFDDTGGYPRFHLLKLFKKKIQHSQKKDDDNWNESTSLQFTQHESRIQATCKHDRK